VFATSWFDAKAFIDAYYNPSSGVHTDLAIKTTSAFKELFAEIRRNGEPGAS